MAEHIYQRSIDCALRHITVSRDNFAYHYADDFDIDWAMEQFAHALDILENLKEYKAPAWEENA
jgi:hypothetical protein